MKPRTTATEPMSSLAIERFAEHYTKYRGPVSRFIRTNRLSLITWAVAFASVLTFLYWVIWVAPEQLASPSPTESELSALEGKERVEAQLAYANAKNAVRTTLIQALAGAAFLVTAFFAWRQVTVTRLGQMIDRFARSLEHIGDRSVAVRVGAIHTLEQLSEDERFAAPVAHVLVAFLHRGSTEAGVSAGEERRAQARARRHGSVDATPDTRLAEIDIQQAASIAITRGLLEASRWNTTRYGSGSTRWGQLATG
jgi:hypothetical protein